MQRLESQTMSDKERRKEINELCITCSRHCVIPNSMRVPDRSNDLTNMEYEYRGGFASVFRSTYGRYQVAIKVVHTNTSTLTADRSVSVLLLLPSNSRLRTHHRVFAKKWWPGNTFGIQTSRHCSG